jgi:ADP-ribose pyrophosphatase YjhB (NUDIX family)
MNKKRYAALIETDVGLLIVQEKKDKEVPHLYNSLFAQLTKLEFDRSTFKEKAYILQSMHASIVHMLEGFLTTRLTPENNVRRKYFIFQEIYRFVELLENLPESYKVNLPMEEIVKNVNTISIVLGGRYALPGGGMEDIDASPEDTIVREIQEELRLEVEKVQYAFTLPGEKRTHEMYLVKAVGKVVPNLDEISGIGFLNEENIFPIRTTFFQGHLVWLHKNYFTSDQAGLNRQAASQKFMSDLTIQNMDIERWFVQEAHVAQLRAKTKEFEVTLPAPTELLRVAYNRHAEQKGRDTYQRDYRRVKNPCSDLSNHRNLSTSAILPSVQLSSTYQSPTKTKFSDSQEFYIGELISEYQSTVASISNKISSVSPQPSLPQTSSKCEDPEILAPESDTLVKSEQQPQAPSQAGKKSASYPRPDISKMAFNPRIKGTYRKQHIISSNIFRPPKPKKA